MALKAGVTYIMILFQYIIPLLASFCRRRFLSAVSNVRIKGFIAVLSIEPEPVLCEVRKTFEIFDFHRVGQLPLPDVWY